MTAPEGKVRPRGPCRPGCLLPTLRRPAACGFASEQYSVWVSAGGMPNPPRPDAATRRSPIVRWIANHKIWSAAIVVALLIVIAAAGGGNTEQPPLSAATEPTTASPATAVPPTVSQPPKTPKVIVPDVVGLDSQSAAKRLRRLGLTLGPVSKQYSHQKPGTVIHLSIHVGGKVEEGTTVSAVVAKPFPTVPNVVGLSAPQAASKLKAAGYSVRITKQSSSQATGTVIGVSPRSGTELLPGKTITLTVAKKIPQQTQPAPACTPGYSPCLPIGPSDYDCAGGSGDGPAYTAPGVTYRVTGYDPYGLDADNDGYGCE